MPRFVEQSSKFVEVLILAGLLWRFFLKLDTSFFCQRMQRGGKIHALLLHDKRENVAAFATCPEAPPRLRIREDEKRQGTLGMTQARRGTTAPTRSKTC